MKLCAKCGKPFNYPPTDNKDDATPCAWCDPQSPAPQPALDAGEAHAHCWHTRFEASSYCCYCEDLYDVAHSSGQELIAQIARLRQHVKDLNHDFEATVKHCNEFHEE